MRTLQDIIASAERQLATSSESSMRDNGATYDGEQWHGSGDRHAAAYYLLGWRTGQLQGLIADLKELSARLRGES